MSPFPKLYERFDGEISVRLDLFNYVTKKWLKKAAGVGTSNDATNSDFDGL